MRVVSDDGTSPNLIKMAPVAAELARRGVEHVLVHTGQHYDAEMSRVFLDELGIGDPDHELGVGAAAPSEQTGRILERLAPLLRTLVPDVVLVPGDVTSTLAGAVCASQLELRLGHVEAGLRSFDRSMPEERNRIVCDQLADELFIHSPEAAGNLARESAPGRVHDVGNTMIDTLVALREPIAARQAAAGLGLTRGSFILVTLHRPALVDGPLLSETLAQLSELARRIPVVFPVHPRTRARIGEVPGVHLCPPLGYLDFLSLVTDARGVLTDSGGIQEETTYLGIPCLTLRSTTERPITVELGTNVLLGLDPARIAEVPALIEQIAARPHRIPPGWDGFAARRIADVLLA